MFIFHFKRKNKNVYILHKDNENHDIIFTKIKHISIHITVMRNTFVVLNCHIKIMSNIAIYFLSKIFYSFDFSSSIFHEIHPIRNKSFFFVLFQVHRPLYSRTVAMKKASYSRKTVALHIWCQLVSSVKIVFPIKHQL